MRSDSRDSCTPDTEDQVCNWRDPTLQDLQGELGQREGESPGSWIAWYKQHQSRDPISRETCLRELALKAFVWPLTSIHVSLHWCLHSTHMNTHIFHTSYERKTKEIFLLSRDTLYTKHFLLFPLELKCVYLYMHLWKLNHGPHTTVTLFLHLALYR